MLGLTSTWDRMLGKLGSKRNGKRLCAGRCRRHRSFHIEPLEERALLSVCTWDGGGADNNWYTAANWVGDVRPSPGDDLVFTGATRINTNNNYGAGTQFRSITINNDDFSLSGNSIQLTGGTGVTVASSVAGAAIGLNLAFTNNSIITVGSGAELALSGNVSFSGKQLLVQGAGETSFSGAISGYDFRANAGGTATFTGTSSLTTTAFVIAGSGSSGTINWESTGTLSTDALYVGFGGLGHINQNKGTVATANVTYGLNMCYSDSTYHIEHFEGTPATLSIGSVYTTAPGTIEFAGGNVRATRSFTADSNLSYHIAKDWAYFYPMGYTVTLAGSFSGSGNLMKCYTGTLALNGSGSHTGLTRIDNGGLVLGNSLALQSSTLYLYSGDSGSFSFGTQTSATFGGLSGQRNLSLQNASAAAVALTVGNNNSSTAYSGILSGSGSLTKIGTGTLTFSGANTYTGDTTVAEGALMLSGGNNRLSTSSMIIVTGGVFDLGGNTQYTTRYVYFQGGVVQNGTLETSGAYSYYVAYAGVISANLAGAGSLAMEKESEDTLTLTGSNTFTGITFLWGGTVCFGSHAFDGSGGIVFMDDATLQWSAGNTTDLSDRIQICDGVQATFDTNGNDVTFASSFGDVGPDVDEGSINKAGEGTLTLAAANLYKGGTTVSGGILQIVTTDSLPGYDTPGKVTVANGGTIAVNVGGVGGWASDDIDDLRSYGIFNAGSALGLDTTNGDFTYGSNVSGSLGMAKLGTGTLTLTGTNTFTGNITIHEGTLKVYSVDSLPSNVINDDELEIANTSTETYSDVISGYGRLTKSGAGTLTFNSTQTYTGDTRVQAGTLSVQGNLNSHVTEDGGTVTGVIFYDPHVASAVREALGLDPDAVMTPGDVAELTSLCLDSNLAFSLQGLEYATNLESLTLVPGDYAADMETLSDLSPLMNLDNLTTLVLQGCGLTDAALATLSSDSVHPDALASLDVRYNSLSSIPEEISDYLPSLASLYIYGNSAIADAPTSALSNLAGKLVNVDLEPNNPEGAATIEDLAEALFYLPIEMYEYVLNTIEYQPYAGTMKGALAVLQTGAGNDWDTASLLAGLFSEAGVSTYYVSGIITATAEDVMLYLGVLDAGRAVEVLNTADLNASQNDNDITFDHTWLQTTIDSTTYYFDPSWKFRDFQPGLGNMLSAVSFDYGVTGDYLSEIRVETSVEYYAQEVRDYLADNYPSLTIADVAYDGPIHQQAVDALPTSLPYTVATQDAPVASIPSAYTHQVEVELTGGGQSFNWSDAVPEVSLGQLTIDPNVSGDYARPRLLLDGAQVALCSNWISKDAATTITVTHFYGASQVASVAYSRTASDYIAVGLDANQTSKQMLVDAWSAVNDAQVSKANSGTPTNDELIGGLLFLDAMTYYHRLNESAELVAGLTAAVPVYNYVTSCLVTSTTELQAAPDMNQQVPYLPEWMVIDVQNANPYPQISITSSDSYPLSRWNLLGHTSSALESAVWEELVNISSASTIKSLQYANENSIDILTFDSGDDYATIYAALDGIPTANDVRAYIASAVYYFCHDGYSAYLVDVPNGLTPINDWTGVGFTVKTSSGAVGGYMITPDMATGIMLENIQGGFAAGSQNEVDPIYITVNSTTEGDPIDIANGNVVHEATDFSIPNLGVPLEFSRKYDSFNVDGTGNSDRGLGEGWSFTYSDRLEFDGGSVIWFNGQGIRFTFESDGMGGYVTPETIFGDLVFNGAGYGYTWTDAYANTVTFDDDGRLMQMLDRYGNGVDVTYDGASTRIYQVKDHVTPARSLTFTYTGDHITSIADFSGRTWTYAYTSNRLVSVTTPTNQYTPQQVTAYAYYTDTARAGLLQTVTYPDSTEIDYAYYANRRGFQVTDSNGNADTMLYNLYNLGESEDANFGRTTYIDRRGTASRHTYDENGYLTEVRYSDWTTESYTWNADGLLASATDTYGQVEDYDYDSNGNLTEYIDRAGYVVDYTYTTDGYNNVDTVTYTNDLDGQSYNADLVIDFTYDGSGRLTDRTDSDGVLDYHTVYTYGGAYGSRGLPDTITTPNGYLTGGDSNDYKTTFTYNTAGRILTATYRTSPTNSIVESYSYDSLGNLLTATDGESNVTTYTYDLLDRVLTVAYPDPDGVGGLPAPHETYDYNNAGLLESVTVDTSGVDPLVTSYTYDDMWRVAKIEYADGTYATFGYDQDGNLLSETDQLGNATSYVYDDLGRLTDAILADDSIYTYTYDGGSRMIATTDALGNTTRYDYDVLGRVTKITDADSNESEYAYDAAGNLHTVTDPLDNVTTYGYDNLSRLVTLTEADPDGGGAQTSPVTEYEYDANGNLVSVTDPRDYETTYDYDEADRLIAVNLPDPDGGRPLGILTTEYEYDDAGNLVAVTDPLDNVTTYEYDGLGRLVMVTEPDPDGGGAQTSPVTEYQYDAVGDLVSVTDPLDHATTYQYNLIGQLTSVTDALGNATSYLYDAAGNLIRVADPLTDDEVLSAYALGATTEYVYDSVGQLVSTTDAEGGATAYDYDLNGNLLTLTDPESNTTTWTYDSLGRVISETNELADTRHYVYNAAGLLVRSIDREGRVIVYQYDSLYRNTAEIWYNNATDADADQNRQNTISYTFDAAGNLLTASDAFAEYEFDYDGLGRVYEETQTIDGLTPVIVFSSEYDAAGRRIELAAAIGGTSDFVNTYDYDNLGRMKWVKQTDQGGNAVADKRVDFTYDAASRYASISRYADLLGTDLVATAAYTFDDTNRLTGLVYTQPNSTGLPFYGWQYDAAGRMTWMETIDGEVDYAHDATHQLTDADYDYATDEGYVYDENGNRVTANGSTYVTGPNNQLLEDGTYRYAYDDEGNREFRYVDTDGSDTLNSGDTNITEYVWDNRNRLTEVEHFTTYANYYAGTSDQIVQYTYDCFNRLVRRVLDPDGTSGATPVEQSVYVHEGRQIVAQFDKTGAGDLAATDMSHRYLWNPQAVDQLFSDEQVHYNGGFVTDKLLWALTDHLNSVRDLAEYNAGTDETTIALHRVFDAFGNVTSETGAAECLFGYTGKLFDEATGLQNNWNNWYDANTGRWLSEDKAHSDVNLTRYVGNSPLMNVDPLGLCKEEAKAETKDADSKKPSDTKKPEAPKQAVPGIYYTIITPEGNKKNIAAKDLKPNDKIIASYRVYITSWGIECDARYKAGEGRYIWVEGAGKWVIMPPRDSKYFPNSAPFYPQPTNEPPANPPADTGTIRPTNPRLWNRADQSLWQQGDQKRQEEIRKKTEEKRPKTKAECDARREARLKQLEYYHEKIAKPGNGLIIGAVGELFLDGPGATEFTDWVTGKVTAVQDMMYDLHKKKIEKEYQDDLNNLPK